MPAQMFFFVTLYMQDVLGYSQLQSGLSYLPVSVGIGFGSTVATKMFVRTGTRPIIVSGALLAAGSALGLAVFSGIATSRTSHLLAARTPPPEALTAGFQRALLVSALCLLAAGAIALRASNTHGEPAAIPEPRQNLEPSYDPA